MTPKFFIGVDISKLTLDVAVYSKQKVLTQVTIENNKTALNDLLQKLKEEYKCTRASSFFCAEDMGLYANFLLKVCSSKKLTICMESPLRIKKSLGIQRGKNDVLDSVRIAQYASEHFKTLKVWERPRPAIEQLAELSTLRRRLVKIKGMLTSIKRRQSFFLTKGYNKKLNDYSRSSVSSIKKDIEKVDNEIDQIIKQDEHLNRLNEIVTSVLGVGRVIAFEMIIYTNEFKSISSAKKFACFCGIAPFTWTSGTSVKGKPKVSHHANRQLKGLIHIAALKFAKRGNSFLARYYQRKVAEGKNKMSVLNAVRNKLVHRIFSCVRHNKLFTEYQNPVAASAVIGVS
jgi:transposase